MRGRRRYISSSTVEERWGKRLTFFFMYVRVRYRLFSLSYDININRWMFVEINLKWRLEKTMAGKLRYLEYHTTLEWRRSLVAAAYDMIEHDMYIGVSMALYRGIANINSSMISKALNLSDLHQRSPNFIDRSQTQRQG